MAAIAQESNPNEFNEDHDRSLQAMAGQMHSQAAMAAYEGQPPGMPPSSVGAADPNRKSKKGRRKKKRNADENKDA